MSRSEQKNIVRKNEQKDTGNFHDDDRHGVENDRDKCAVTPVRKTKYIVIRPMSEAHDALQVNPQDKLA